jgi:hypothetical protein
MSKISIGEHIAMAQSLKEARGTVRELSKNPVMRETAEKLHSQITLFMALLEDIMVQDHPEMKPEETLDIYF